MAEDIAAGAGPSAFSAAFDKAVGEPTPAPEAPSSGGVEETAPEWEAEAPEEYKGLSSQANVKAEYKKWLRDTYGELHTFKSSPYGTPEALQTLNELVPGGIEDLRTAVEKSQQYAREQELLNSGDPYQMSEVLDGKIMAHAELHKQRMQQNAPKPPDPNEKPISWTAALDKMPVEIIVQKLAEVGLKVDPMSVALQKDAAKPAPPVPPVASNGHSATQ